MMLKISHSQKLQVAELAEQNLALQEQNKALETKVDQLISGFTKMDKMLEMALGQLTQLTDETPAAKRIKTADSRLFSRTGSF